MSATTPNQAGHGTKAGFPPAPPEAHQTAGVATAMRQKRVFQIKALIERDGLTLWATDHDAKPEFFGVYAKEPGGFYEWVEDFPTRDDAIDYVIAQVHQLKH